MPDIDIDKLNYDVRPLLPRTLRDNERPIVALGVAHSIPESSVFVMADNAVDALALRDLSTAFWNCLSLHMAMLNRDSIAGEGDQKIAAHKAVKKIQKHMRKNKIFAEGGNKISLLRSTLDKTGYQLNGLHADCLDFLEDWAPVMHDHVNQMTRLREEHEVTVFSALLGLGVGHLIRPFDLVMQRPVYADDVSIATELMLAKIEETAHGWALTNMVCNDSLRRLLVILTSNPGKNLYPAVRPAAAKNILHSAKLADRVDALPLSEVFKDAASVFEQEVRIPRGENPTGRITEFVNQIIDNTDVPGIRLREVVVMDDQGQIVTLEEFYAEQGEEVPQHVRDAIQSHDPGKG